MNIFNRPNRQHNRQPKVDRDAVDDVLELSTTHNLEHHADKASTIAENQLTDASKKEDEANEQLVNARLRYELSVSRRIAKEKLIRSIASVIRGIRK